MNHHYFVSYCYHDQDTAGFGSTILTLSEPVSSPIHLSAMQRKISQMGNLTKVVVLGFNLLPDVWATTAKVELPKCDGNHGGSRCEDPKCWQADPSHLHLHELADRLAWDSAEDLLAGDLKKAAAIVRWAVKVLATEPLAYYTEAVDEFTKTNAGYETPIPDEAQFIMKPTL